MKSFLGIDNVIGATPILGADGVADGFDVIYIRNGREMGKRVWVREYTDPVEPRKKRVSKKRVVSPKKEKINLANLQKIVDKARKS